jgi:hypothetical protein
LIVDALNRIYMNEYYMSRALLYRWYYKWQHTVSGLIGGAVGWHTRNSLEVGWHPPEWTTVKREESKITKNNNERINNINN